LSESDKSIKYWFFTETEKKKVNELEFFFSFFWAITQILLAGRQKLGD